MEMDEIIGMLHKFSGSIKDQKLHEYGSAHYKKEYERQIMSPPGLRWSDSSETGMSGD
jgi:hypothetical protein